MADLTQIELPDGNTYNIKDANAITGSGTSGSLAKFNGASSVTDGPALGSDTTKFLRNDGTWQVPSGSGSNTWEGTQAQYDALPSHNPNTVYYITDGSPIDANLDDLADVSILSPANGDTLKYSSGSWVNSAAEVMQNRISQNSTDTTTYRVLFGKANPGQSGEAYCQQNVLNYTPYSSYYGGPLLTTNSPTGNGTILSDTVKARKYIISPNSSDEIILPHTYSTTEEKKVGYWIDGTTPIYEITYMDLSTITINANSTVDLVSWTTPIQPVSFKAYRYQKSGSSIFYAVWEHFGCQWQDNKLQAFNACGVQRALNGFTVQYFKLPT